MGWRVASGGCGFSPIGDVDTAAKAPLGTIVTAQHETYGVGEFIYLKGVASTALGSVVTYSSDDYATALLARDAIGPVAVAMGATVADTFGWYQIGGKGFALSNDAADNASVYSTTTSGTIDDAASTGNRVQRAKTASADDTATGLVEVEMERPFVDDALGAGTT